MTTRAEHLAWCKRRALRYVDEGEIGNAVASMASDLAKHPETSNHPGIVTGMSLFLLGRIVSADEVRRHIEGYR